MKYKVGDKVRVREDLVVGKRYGSFEYSWGMVNNSGKIVTVQSVFNHDKMYAIKEDGGYHWTDEMLEDIEPEISEAEMVLQTLNDEYWTGNHTEIFGADYSILTLIEDLTPSEIISKIKNWKEKQFIEPNPVLTCSTYSAYSANEYSPVIGCDTEVFNTEEIKEYITKILKDTNASSVDISLKYDRSK